MLDNVNTVLLALRRRYNQNTFTKAEEVRRKRRMKEQKRKNKTKKLNVLSRQAKEVCKRLNRNGEIDITQKASIAVKVDEIKSNSANSDSGYSYNWYNIQRLQSISHAANSEDVFRCERAIGA